MSIDSKHQSPGFFKRSDSRVGSDQPSSASSPDVLKVPSSQNVKKEDQGQIAKDEQMARKISSLASAQIAISEITKDQATWPNALKTLKTDLQNLKDVSDHDKNWMVAWLGSQLANRLIKSEAKSEDYQNFAAAIEKFTIEENLDELTFKALARGFLGCLTLNQENLGQNKNIFSYENLEDLVSQQHKLWLKEAIDPIKDVKTIREVIQGKSNSKNNNPANEGNRDTAARSTQANTQISAEIDGNGEQNEHMPPLVPVNNPHRQNPLERDTKQEQSALSASYLVGASSGNAACMEEAVRQFCTRQAGVAGNDSSFRQLAAQFGLEIRHDLARELLQQRSDEPTLLRCTLLAIQLLSEGGLSGTGISAFVDGVFANQVAGNQAAPLTSQEKTDREMQIRIFAAHLKSANYSSLLDRLKNAINLQVRLSPAEKALLASAADQGWNHPQSIIDKRTTNSAVAENAPLIKSMKEEHARRTAMKARNAVSASFNTLRTYLTTKTRPPKTVAHIHIKTLLERLTTAREAAGLLGQLDQNSPALADLRNALRTRITATSEPESIEHRNKETDAWERMVSQLTELKKLNSADEVVSAIVKIESDDLLSWGNYLTVRFTDKDSKSAIAKHLMESAASSNEAITALTKAAQAWTLASDNVALRSALIELMREKTKSHPARQLGLLDAFRFTSTKIASDSIAQLNLLVQINSKFGIDNSLSADQLNALAKDPRAKLNLNKNEKAAMLAGIKDAQACAEKISLANGERIYISTQESVTEKMKALTIYGFEIWKRSPAEFFAQADLLVGGFSEEEKSWALKRLENNWPGDAANNNENLIEKLRVMLTPASKPFEDLPQKAGGRPSGDNEAENEAFDEADFSPVAGHNPPNDDSIHNAEIEPISGSDSDEEEEQS